MSKIKPTHAYDPFFQSHLTDYPLIAATRNLTRFCEHPDYETLDKDFIANFAHRSSGSRFGFLKNPKSEPGPDQCFSYFLTDSRSLFDKLLGLEWHYPDLSKEKAPHLNHYTSAAHYRTHVDEFFSHNGYKPVPPVEGHCLMYAPHSDRVAIHFTFRNPSATVVKIEARWFSKPSAGLKSTVHAEANRLRVAVEQEVNGTYTAHARLTAETDGIRFVEQDSRWITTPVAFELKAGEQKTFAFALDCWINDESEPADQPLPTHWEGLKPCLDEAEACYASLEKIATDWKPYQPIMTIAAGVMLSSRYHDYNTSKERVMSLHGGKCGVCATWWWDGGFTFLGYGLTGHTAPAWGAARVLLDGVAEDGSPSVYYSGGEYKPGYQQPVVAWGIAHLAKMDSAGAEKNLADFYDPLCRYVNHWFNACDSNKNGLVEYPKGAVCWDDSFRWMTGHPLDFKVGDTWHEKTYGKFVPERFDCVDTNAHLYLECISLARIAEKLGKPDEAKAWLERGQALADRINAELYNEEDGIYQDRDIDGDRPFTRMITPACFLPIYAGIVPQERARTICERYLLNPERLYTPLPFPTLDRSHPAFRGGGYLHTLPQFPGSLIQQAYWTGRSWLHNNLWMIGALQACGLTAEADQAAERTLHAISRHESIYECYDPLTGSPNGHPEFPWPSSSILALGLRYYQGEPVPAKL